MTFRQFLFVEKEICFIPLFSESSPMHLRSQSKQMSQFNANSCEGVCVCGRQGDRVADDYQIESER